MHKCHHVRDDAANMHKCPDVRDVSTSTEDLEEHVKEVRSTTAVSSHPQERITTVTMPALGSTVELYSGFTSLASVRQWTSHLWNEAANTNKQFCVAVPYSSPPTTSTTAADACVQPAPPPTFPQSKGDADPHT